MSCKAKRGGGPGGGKGGGQEENTTPPIAGHRSIGQPTPRRFDWVRPFQIFLDEDLSAAGLRSRRTLRSKLRSFAN